MNYAAIIYCMLTRYVLCTHGPNGLLYSLNQLALKKLSLVSILLWGSPSIFFYVFFFFIFFKKDSFCDILFAFLDDKTLLKGSTVKGKNLLLQEQILCFNS